MKIGILEAGAPPEALAPRFGRYGGMMARLLGDGFETRFFRVQAGELPDRSEAFDGYIVTGSAAGAYEDLPWIAPLSGFLQEARGRARLVGICFGHQLMAQAFGGRVEKSAKGWGLGLHRYASRAGAPWPDESFAIPVSHQDQVVTLPPGARVVAASAFTPAAALLYDGHPSLSFQGHPEFEPAYARALLDLRHAVRLPPAEYERLSASLNGPNDCDRVARWIRAFLAGDEPSGARARQAGSAEAVT